MVYDHGHDLTAYLRKNLLYDLPFFEYAFILPLKWAHGSQIDNHWLKNQQLLLSALHRHKLKLGTLKNWSSDFAIMIKKNRFKKCPDLKRVTIMSLSHIFRLKNCILLVKQLSHLIVFVTDGPLNCDATRFMPTKCDKASCAE